MAVRTSSLLLVFSICVAVSRADETLYRYEGDVMPADPEAGWLVYNVCEPPCAETVEDGHFVAYWPNRLGGDFFQYGLRITQPPADPPPTLWAEWRFRSNCPLGHVYFSTHGQFTVRYREINETVHLYGDAAISFGGDYWIGGLSVDTFHTYRFESLDGEDYAFAVDGERFIVGTGAQASALTTLLMLGFGECETETLPDSRNYWDFVRHGTLSSGELVASTDPPAGYLDPAAYGNLDRFTVTFDHAAYVYIDDVTVQVTGGVAPVVIATQRKENTEPDTVEIVLDRPLPMNETTTFTFDTGAGARQENVVEYRLGVGPVPATSGVALTAMIAAILAAGILLARRGAALRPD